MERILVHFSANEQKLICSDPFRVSSYKVQYIEAHFDLGQNWSGFDSVRAVWWNDFATIGTVLDSLGVCRVPAEVLRRKGPVMVNLVGSISDGDVLTDRLTTYPVEAGVVDANAKIDGPDPHPATPSQVEQFAAAVREDADRAEQGATDAQTYAQNASNSATSASNSATAAHDDKIAIEEAIAEVIQQIEDFEQVQVVVNTLPPSSQATSDFTDGVLTLGIPQGVKGDTGNGIQSIAKTGTSGLVDTYRITYTDGQTTTFTVTNGAKGDTGNGIQSIAKTSTVGLVDTYTITYTNGTTTTFTVTNGEKGDKGDTGEVSLSELEDATVVQTLSDTEPYHFRQTNNGNGCGHKEYDEIVGASVGWNQLVPTNKKSKTTTPTAPTTYQSVSSGVTLKAGHIYFVSAEFSVATSRTNIRPYIQNGTNTYVRGGSQRFIPASGGKLLYGGFSRNTDADYELLMGVTTTVALTTDDVWTYDNFMVTDVTLALGSTIADYLFSFSIDTAEEALASLGRWRKLFPLDYYAYDSGSIQSVSGLSKHVMRDADDNIIGEYAFDSTITLRGKLKLQDGKLYADGDRYPSSGEGIRNWDEVDLGSLNWTNVGVSGKHIYSASVSGKGAGRDTMVCSKYPLALAGYDEMPDKTITSRYSSPTDHIYIRDESYTTASALKTSLDGVKLVFNLATPTTFSADPYTNPQTCDPNGTEEYVSTSIVPIGHNTDYPMTLIDTMPTANGNYTMKLNVASGKKTITWQSV